MEKIQFKNAYYVKLGRKGKWEEDSIKNSIVRVGWKRQNINDILNNNWKLIESQIRQEMSNPGAAKRDFQMLKTFCESTSDDLWVTFYSSKLWWCRLNDEKIKADEISKYRRTKDGWKNKDILGNHLITNQITGRLAQLQAFRGTICGVKPIVDLNHLINADSSAEYKEILQIKNTIVKQLEKGIQRLHWKDFEILVDLIFRQAGWKRISVIGETMKGVDLELMENITKDRYHVQIKSKASLNDFKQYANTFSNRGFKKLYFIVHSPENSLLNYNQNEYDNVELIFSNRLSNMVVDSGLIDWVMDKIK